MLLPTSLTSKFDSSHSWFAVHSVSMNYTNRMVSSDNMGYASYLMEQDKNPGDLPGQVCPARLFIRRK